MKAAEPRLWRENDLIVSTDAGRLDVATIHAFLTTSYWSPGIPRRVVEKAIKGSLCFGAYAAPPDAPAGPWTQIAFARVITDAATFAYLADVFVLEPWRDRGVGRFLIRCVVDHPDLQSLRRFMLLTRDAHGLYSRFGFAPCAHPERVMERLDPDVYKRA